MSLAGEAFTRYVDRLRPNLAAFARRRLQPAGVDDAVGETVLRAWQRISHFDERTGETGFSKWMFAILRRVCQEGVASQQRIETMVEEIRADVTMERPNDVAAHREMVAIVLAAPLSKMQTLCFTGYWLGVETADMAECFGIEPATVRKHVQLAREQIRAAAKDHEA